MTLGRTQHKELYKEPPINHRKNEERAKRKHIRNKK